MYLANPQIAALIRLAHEQQLIEATTCRDEFVCRRAGDDNWYEPPVSELPFGPMWIPQSSLPPSSPVEPRVSTPQPPRSFADWLGNMQWRTDQHQPDT